MRVLFAGVNILCVFANVQNLKIVFVMSRRIVPVAAARFCHRGEPRPVTLPVAVRGVGRCCSLLVLLPVAACCLLVVWLPAVSRSYWLIDNPR